MKVNITSYKRPAMLEKCVESLYRSGIQLNDIQIRFDGTKENNPYRPKGTAWMISNQVSGTFIACKEAITWGFDVTADDYTVYMQDDVIVSPDWLDKSMMMIPDIQDDCGGVLGIFSPWNRKTDIKGKWGYFNTGHPGACAWIVSRVFWNDYTANFPQERTLEMISKNDRRTQHFMLNICDFKICNAAQKMGYKVAVSGKSYCQHIGDKSTLSDRDMSEFRSNRFVG
jgi:hypothetical protein